MGHISHLLGDNTEIIKGNKETLIHANNELGLEVNMAKTTYMLVFCYQNAEQNRDIKIGNRALENVSQYKYLGDK
jgi:hypothetical protein